MKKVCLISKRQDLIKSIKDQLNDVNTDVFDYIPNTSDYDLTVLTDFYSDIKTMNGEIIRSHLSLFPSFNTTTPIKDAYLSGVKVTGITINKVENNDLTGLILAQYPVMIDNFTSYSQLEEELFSLENKLLPLVIKSVIEDKVFDIIELLTPTKTCGGCGNCGKCN